MNSLKFAFVSILVIGAVTNAQSVLPDDGSCRTPENHRGNCVNILHCPSLLEILSNKPVSPQDSEFLQNSGCGFEGKNPKVCCPLPQDTYYPEDVKEESARVPEVPPTTFSSTSKTHPNRHILGECVPAANINNIYTTAPWITLIGYPDENGKMIWVCEGTVISKRYVLTSAHCVLNKSVDYRLWKVRLGEHDLSNEGQDCVSDTCLPLPVDIRIEEINLQPWYNQPYLWHDLALVRLSSPVTFSRHIQPICLDRLEHLDDNHEGMLIVGWSGANFYKSERVGSLEHLYVKTVSPGACAEAHHEQGNIGGGHVCVQSALGTNPCIGDALIFVREIQTKWFTYLGGMRSEICILGNPALFTNVGSYMQWILDTIRP